MVTINEVIDLELDSADGTVFCLSGWHAVENRPLTDDECQYLENNYSTDLHYLACEVLR